MRILLTNDDGVSAIGIKTLYETLKDLADVWIVAPNEERSATGHSISFGRKVYLKEEAKQIYSCSGFPPDCVLLGLGHVLKDKKIDLVVSGINHGGNLGQDVYYSGTVAGAREACFCDTPAISISSALKTLKIKQKDVLYQTAADYLKYCIEKGLHQIIPPKMLVNINVPNVSKEKLKGIQIGQLGFNNYALEVKKDGDGFNIGGIRNGHYETNSSDCEIVHNKCISISILNHLVTSENYEEIVNEFIKRELLNYV